MDLVDLERAQNVFGIGDPHVAPAGTMAQFVGPQLPPEELARWSDAKERDPLDPVVLRCIRSFPVPCLLGPTITCPPSEFGPRLREVLVEWLPGTEWQERHFLPHPNAPVGHFSRCAACGHPIDNRNGLVEKYHILDGGWVAPADAATGQTMVLELGGHVANIDGTPAIERRIKLRADDGGVRDPTPAERAEMEPRWALQDPFTPVVEVTVRSAHWTNVAGVRVGVGFYM